MKKTRSERCPSLDDVVAAWLRCDRASKVHAGFLGPADARAYFQGYIGAALDGVGRRRDPPEVRKAIAITRKWLEWSPPTIVYVRNMVMEAKAAQDEREACRVACEGVAALHEGDESWSKAVAACCDAIARRNVSGG